MSKNEFPSRQSFGRYIAEARQRLGKTQKEIAEQLGISAQYLNDLEHDRRNPPSDALMRNLAQVLGVDGDLLYWRARRWPPDIQAKPIPLDEFRETMQKVRSILFSPRLARIHFQSKATGDEGHGAYVVEHIARAAKDEVQALFPHLDFWLEYEDDHHDEDHA